MLAVAALKQTGEKVRTANRKFEPIERSALLEHRGEKYFCSVHDSIPVTVLVRSQTHRVYFFDRSCERQDDALGNARWGGKPAFLV
jgi:hypothetical protein